jgi:leader peptidase (prepilin peptidase)/N-methyltransferase
VFRVNPLLLGLAGVLGLVIGSFLNVVIHRVPRDESLVRPGSRCPSCEAPLRARHLVPVLSWLVLRGRCASCSARISARYPLVELTTAALFVAVAARFGATAALPAYLYLAAVGVALAMIDIDVQRLPNVIVLPSYLVGGVLFVPAVIADGSWGTAARALMGAAALFAAYYVLALVHPAGMGLGDVKLAGLLGLYLGWLGWAAVLVGTSAALLLGLVFGLALMVAGRAGRKSAIPFGPFMLGGAFLALFIAAPVADWYGNLLVPAT